MPLSLYLLTFVIVFRERALIPQRWLLAIHLVAVVIALLQLAQTERDTWFYAAGLGVAAFFTSALVAHRTLYEQRPAPRYLTEFYMWMSLGGVLGGVFAALIAPRIFSEVFEYPLLLALSFACRPGALSLATRSRDNPKVIFAFGALLMGGVLLIIGLPWAAAKIGTTFGVWGSTFAVAAVLAAATLVAWRFPPLQLTAVLLMYATIVILPSNVHRGQAQRSYFGVYRVILSDDGQFNVLQHGTTLHGAQRVRDESGQSHRQHHARHLLLPTRPHGLRCPPHELSSARSSARILAMVSLVSAPDRSPAMPPPARRGASSRSTPPLSASPNRRSSPT